jgi:hypothetical protein
VVEQGIWRIRTNQELRGLYKDLDLAALKRTDWNGLDMLYEWVRGRIVKKVRVYENKPEESRRKGNARLRWLEDVDKGRWEMKVKSWRQKAVDREEWAFVIKEANALRGPYSRGVSK